MLEEGRKVGDRGPARTFGTPTSVFGGKTQRRNKRQKAEKKRIMLSKRRDKGSKNEKFRLINEEG